MIIINDPANISNCIKDDFLKQMYGKEVHDKKSFNNALINLSRAFSHDRNLIVPSIKAIDSNHEGLLNFSIIGRLPGGFARNIVPGSKYALTVAGYKITKVLVSD